MWGEGQCSAVTDAAETRNPKILYKAGLYKKIAGTHCTFKKRLFIVVGTAFYQKAKPQMYRTNYTKIHCRSKL